MLPVYCLSIVLNALTGYILAFRQEETTEESLSFNFDSLTTRLLIGVLCALMGFIKLLSPVKESIIIIGDLVPALTGLCGGFILIYEFYGKRTTISSPKAELLAGFIAKNRTIAGFICIGAAVIHLFFSSIPLL